MLRGNCGISLNCGCPAPKYSMVQVLILGDLKTDFKLLVKI